MTGLYALINTLPEVTSAQAGNTLLWMTDSYRKEYYSQISPKLSELITNLPDLMSVISAMNEMYEFRFTDKKPILMSFRQMLADNVKNPDDYFRLEEKFGAGSLIDPLENSLANIFCNLDQVGLIAKQSSSSDFFERHKPYAMLLKTHVTSAADFARVCSWYSDSSDHNRVIGVLKPDLIRRIVDAKTLIEYLSAIPEAPYTWRNDTIRTMLLKLLTDEHCLARLPTTAIEMQQIDGLLTNPFDKQLYYTVMSPVLPSIVQDKQTLRQLCKEYDLTLPKQSENRQGLFASLFGGGNTTASVQPKPVKPGA